MANPHLFEEDFAQGHEQWWFEGGHRVWIDDGHLYTHADRPSPSGIGGGDCTAWCRVPHPAGFELTLQARIVHAALNSNHLGLLFACEAPDGESLYRTREDRRDGAFHRYQHLNGYALSYLNVPVSGRKAKAAHRDGTPLARARLRRCPDFEPLGDNAAYHCRQGVTYALKLRKEGGRIDFEVDGQPVLTATDPAPWGAGYFALRTYRSIVWWSAIRVTGLNSPVKKG